MATARTEAALPRRISHSMPTRSYSPASPRDKLPYFEAPARRARWLTATLRVFQPARCMSAGR